MHNRITRITAVVVGAVLAVSGFAYAAADETGTQPDPVVFEEPATDEAQTDEPAGEDAQTGEPAAEEPDSATTNEATPTDEPQAVVQGVERSTDGCGEGTYRNHGQYVRSTTERPRRDAAHSNCGKPAHTVADDGGTEEDPPDEPDVEITSSDDTKPGKRKGHVKRK